MEYDNEFEKELDDIQDWAKSLAEPIINKLAYRVIRNMNKHITRDVYDSDYYKIGAKNFFDIFSILIQSQFCEEIMLLLPDTITNWIDLEVQALPKTERFILHCATISESMHDGYDTGIIRELVYERFNELYNKHYETQKVQRIVERSY